MGRDRERTQDPGEIHIAHDPISESVVLAAALVNAADRRKLVVTLAPGRFFEPKHQAAWAALCELERRKLGFDMATLQKLGDVDASYLKQLVKDRPESPKDLAFHVEQVLWDNARLNAARGPVHELIKALNDPTADPAVVKSMARRVSTAFDDYRARGYLRDAGQLANEVVSDVRQSQIGVQVYSFGINRLDYYEGDGRSITKPLRRMIPGASPGTMTMVTGRRSIGKSTFIAHMVLGLARNRRRVLYGAWEMNSRTMLKILACMSCGYERSRLYMKESEGGLRPEEVILLEERAHLIAKHVAFMDMPFHRDRDTKGNRGGNQRNLDKLHGYIADSGCDVFVGDLMARALVELRPEDEVLAVERLQSMAEETKVHLIVAHQQLTKGDNVRADMRPTAEGAKGSTIWSEAADNVIGIHRPGAIKAVPDDKLEAVILKQRYGRAPQIVEFDWDPDTGLITGGVTRTFDYGAEAGGVDNWMNAKGDKFKSESDRKKRH